MPLNHRSCATRQLISAMTGPLGHGLNTASSKLVIERTDRTSRTHSSSRQFQDHVLGALSIRGIVSSTGQYVIRQVRFSLKDALFSRCHLYPVFHFYASVGWYSALTFDLDSWCRSRFAYPSSSIIRNGGQAYDDCEWELKGDGPGIDVSSREEFSSRASCIFRDVSDIEPDLPCSI
nr:hypothetical protein CFP56_02872 [Quercus suber]